MYSINAPQKSFVKLRAYPRRSRHMRVCAAKRSALIDRAGIAPKMQPERYLSFRVAKEFIRRRIVENAMLLPRAWSPAAPSSTGRAGERSVLMATPVRHERIPPTIVLPVVDSEAHVTIAGNELNAGLSQGLGLATGNLRIMPMVYNMPSEVMTSVVNTENQGNQPNVSGFSPSRFSVAPMMDWTDRHCRSFHRLLTRRALLYTEMVTAPAIVHGDRRRLLEFSPAEHPVALQIGGSEPDQLAEAARIGAEFGYDEINLNVGCPSDRVQSGRFGACLMLEPDLVANCVAAMKAAVTVPVTVKCRIGVDDQDPRAALWRLTEALVANGVDGLIVHARKAWLQGLVDRVIFGETCDDSDPFAVIA
eukprot:gene20762-21465_t